ncbi:hypothetical protein ACER0C_007054 [Sarotherodon galilaeus]
MFSMVEAESGDKGDDPPISGGEVTEAIKQILGGRAPRVDEVRPEFLKALDVVGLSWLTCLYNVAWRSGAVPLDWQTGVVVPIFKKGGQRMCSNYKGITLLSLPGKVYAMVLERRVHDVVLLASSNDGLQLTLERFAAECEAVGMRISTSKSEAMVLSRKRVECPFRVRDEFLHQVEEFKYLGVLFTSDGRREREIDRRIGAAATAMRTLLLW